VSPDQIAHKPDRPTGPFPTSLSEGFREMVIKPSELSSRDESALLGMQRRELDALFAVAFDVEVDHHRCKGHHLFPVSSDHT